MLRYLILALFFVIQLSESFAEKHTSKPNILWFVVEDMSAHFSCYGETLISTPNIDELAKDGTLFSHAFVTAPVCSASRSALITGRYQTSIDAHHHRSGRGVEKIHLPENVTPIPQLFQQAGYYTCVGDGLLNSKIKNVAKSALGKTDYNFEYDEKMYHSNDWSARKQGQPFFMQVQLTGGKLRGNHEASNRSCLQLAAKEFGNSTDPGKVKLPPYYPNDPILQLDWAAYLDSVRLTDAHVGKVVARLKEENLLENTLILFITDHGISHARGKQFLYDEGTHIPFIARGPGIPIGKKRDDLIEHIDMAAISLSAAGIDIPHGMHAQNIFAKGYKPRSHIFAARDRCDETVDRIRSVRSEQYLYIRNFYPLRPMLQPCDYKDRKSIIQKLRQLHEEKKLSPLSINLLFSPTRPQEELYEWKADQYQIKNLAQDSNYSSALESMRSQMESWIKETNDFGRNPETALRYDSDMAVYIGGGNPGVERNIGLMKEWQKEGK